MMQITGSQRRYLKSLAHHLDPVCFIGKGGLTDAVIQAVDLALDAHELVKVKFIDFKKEKKELATQLETDTESVLVGLIGHIAILYRPQPDADKRKITLPED